MENNIFWTEPNVTKNMLASSPILLQWGKTLYNNSCLWALSFTSVSLTWPKCKMTVVFARWVCSHVFYVSLWSVNLKLHDCYNRQVAKTGTLCNGWRAMDFPFMAKTLTLVLSRTLFKSNLQNLHSFFLQICMTLVLVTLTFFGRSQQAFFFFFSARFYIK